MIPEMTFEQLLEKYKDYILRPITGMFNINDEKDYIFIQETNLPTIKFSKKNDEWKIYIGGSVYPSFHKIGNYDEIDWNLVDLFLSKILNLYSSQRIEHYEWELKIKQELCDSNKKDLKEFKEKLENIKKEIKCL